MSDDIETECFKGQLYDPSVKVRCNREGNILHINCPGLFTVNANEYPTARDIDNAVRVYRLGYDKGLRDGADIGKDDLRREIKEILDIE